MTIKTTFNIDPEVAAPIDVRLDCNIAPGENFRYKGLLRYETKDHATGQELDTPVWRYWDGNDWSNLVTSAGGAGGPEPVFGSAVSFRATSLANAAEVSSESTDPQIFSNRFTNVTSGPGLNNGYQICPDFGTPGYKPYDPATGYFTAPYHGLYYFRASIVWKVNDSYVTNVFTGSVANAGPVAANTNAGISDAYRVHIALSDILSSSSPPAGYYARTAVPINPFLLMSQIDNGYSGDVTNGRLSHARWQGLKDGTPQVCDGIVRLNAGQQVGVFLEGTGTLVDGSTSTMVTSKVWTAETNSCSFEGCLIQRLDQVTQGTDTTTTLNDIIAHYNPLNENTTSFYATNLQGEQLNATDLQVSGSISLPSSFEADASAVTISVDNLYLGSPNAASYSSQPVGITSPGRIICDNITHPGLVGSYFTIQADGIAPGSTNYGVQYRDYRAYDNSSVYQQAFIPTFNAVSAYGAGIDLGGLYEVWRQVWCKLLNVNGAYITSDDRLKFNEAPIANSLATIKKLQAFSYDKAEGLDNLNERSPGVGLIAQHVLAIPELAFAVSGGGQHTDKISGEVKEIPYALDYTAVLVHVIEAVKELDKIVQSQQQTIEALQARVAALEA